jgi:DNA-binding MurR/RpiR family transcriptional regulator
MAGTMTSDGYPSGAAAADFSRRGPGAIPPLARLQAVNLTAVEGKLAVVLARQYPEAALLSARGMATAAGTSQASVTRFARKLGYAGFAELRAELAVDMRARLASPPKRLSVDAASRRKTVTVLLREVIARDRANLDATLCMIDETQLDAVARRLAHDTRSPIYIAGSKKGGIVASYFAMQLAQLRPGVRLLSLSELLADNILDLTSVDLLVVFEPRRATAALVRLLEEARSLGTQVVAFTDEHPPAILAAADFLFRTKVDAISLFDSYAAMFALCDALLAAVVQHAPKAVRARTERLEALNASLATWAQDL